MPVPFYIPHWQERLSDDLISASKLEEKSFRDFLKTHEEEYKEFELLADIVYRRGKKP